MSNREYWKTTFHDASNVATGDLQSNVGRTVNGNPVDDETWNQTIGYIAQQLKLDSRSDILELCCGNGLVIGPLSKLSRSAFAIDFSNLLIDQLNELYGDTVEARVDDVMEVTWDKQSLDAIIIYFSIQHFSDAECLALIKKSLDWLRPDGRLFIGDIPDAGKKWQYLNRPEFRRDFLQRIIEGRPKIGNWYQPEFFKAMKDFFPRVEVEVLKQPSYQINSAIRFDVMLRKVAV